MSSEADLLALMRADRQVQNRRRAAQLLIDLEATEAAGSSAKVEHVPFKKMRSKLKAHTS
jgi:hypothetical protein